MATLSSRDADAMAATDPSDQRPGRLFTTCRFGDEGEIIAEGKGRPELWERFTISANGGLVDMVCIEVRTGDSTDWSAVDVETFQRRYGIAQNDDEDGET